MVRSDSRHTAEVSVLSQVCRIWQPDGCNRQSPQVHLAVPLLASLLLIAALFAGDARGSDHPRMQTATDLRSEAGILRAEKRVLVLEFSSEDCGYCRKLEKLFLIPMQRNPEYDDKVIIRSIPLDDFGSIIDFNGRSLSISEFAARYGVSVTPTLLFLNADGEEISDRLVGIWSEDFYGAFIDNRIEQANKRL